MGDVLFDLMAASGWSGAADWAGERREHAVVDGNGKLIVMGALASTIVSRKGSPREKERDRWAAKGVTIAGIPKAAPTEEEAQVEGFFLKLTLRMRARLQDFPDD
jgi:DNA (cytosine-5)-methyltransferase 1